MNAYFRAHRLDIHLHHRTPSPSGRFSFIYVCLRKLKILFQSTEWCHNNIIRQYYPVASVYPIVTISPTLAYGEDIGVRIRIRYLPVTAKSPQLITVTAIQSHSEQLRGKPTSRFRTKKLSVSNLKISMSAGSYLTNVEYNGLEI